MATSPETMFLLSFIANAVLITVLLVIHMWNPYAVRMAWAKRIVFVIKQDGDIEPVSAWDEGGAYVTGSHGRFDFDRKDVVRYGKKPAIFALEWMSRAVRPDCVQGLDFLKKNKIKRYDMLLAVLNSDVISQQEYIDTYVNKGKKQVAEIPVEQPREEITYAEETPYDEFEDQQEKVT